MSELDKKVTPEGIAMAEDGLNEESIETGAELRYKYRE